MVDTAAYLQRIGYSGSVSADSETLRNLHRAHLFTVPFENLDIGWGRRIQVEEQAFVRKIVAQHRGGFCYELNGAFAALLRTLGFKVTLLSARVPRVHGDYGPEFDHLTLRVDLNEPWLADVGFGDCFCRSLTACDGFGAAAKRGLLSGCGDRPVSPAGTEGGRRKMENGISI
jgi:N-hydroxyarylamine O-acetyltransferase